jgi:hypothetical protein
MGVHNTSYDRVNEDNFAINENEYSTPPYRSAYNSADLSTVDHARLSALSLGKNRKRASIVSPQRQTTISIKEAEGNNRRRDFW